MKPGVKKPTLGPTFPLENVHLRNVCETCSLLSTRAVSPCLSGGLCFRKCPSKIGLEGASRATGHKPASAKIPGLSCQDLRIWYSGFLNSGESKGAGFGKSRSIDIYSVESLGSASETGERGETPEGWLSYSRYLSWENDNVIGLQFLWTLVTHSSQVNAALVIPNLYEIDHQMKYTPMLNVVEAKEFVFLHDALRSRLEDISLYSQCNAFIFCRPAKQQRWRN